MQLIDQINRHARTVSQDSHFGESFPGISVNWESADGTVSGVLKTAPFSGADELTVSTEGPFLESRGRDLQGPLHQIIFETSIPESVFERLLEDFSITNSVVNRYLWTKLNVESRDPVEKTPTLHPSLSPNNVVYAPIGRSQIRFTNEQMTLLVQSINEWVRQYRRDFPASSENLPFIRLRNSRGVELAGPRPEDVGTAMVLEFSSEKVGSPLAPEISWEAALKAIRNYSHWPESFRTSFREGPKLETSIQTAFAALPEPASTTGTDLASQPVSPVALKHFLGLMNVSNTTERAPIEIYNLEAGMALGATSQQINGNTQPIIVEVRPRLLPSSGNGTTHQDWTGPLEEALGHQLRQPGGYEVLDRMATNLRAQPLYGKIDPAIQEVLFRIMEAYELGALPQVPAPAYGVNGNGVHPNGTYTNGASSQSIGGIPRKLLYVGGVFALLGVIFTYEILKRMFVRDTPEVTTTLDSWSHTLQSGFMVFGMLAAAVVLIAAYFGLKRFFGSFRRDSPGGNIKVDDAVEGKFVDVTYRPKLTDHAPLIFLGLGLSYVAAQLLMAEGMMQVTQLDPSLILDLFQNPEGVDGVMANMASLPGRTGPGTDRGFEALRDLAARINADARQHQKPEFRLTDTEGDSINTLVADGGERISITYGREATLDQVLTAFFRRHHEILWGDDKFKDIRDGLIQVWMGTKGGPSEFATLVREQVPALAPYLDIDIEVPAPSAAPVSDSSAEPVMVVGGSPDPAQAPPATPTADEAATTASQSDPITLETLMSDIPEDVRGVVLKTYNDGLQELSHAHAILGIEISQRKPRDVRPLFYKNENRLLLRVGSEVSLKDFLDQLEEMTEFVSQEQWIEPQVYGRTILQFVLVMMDHEAFPDDLDKSIKEVTALALNTPDPTISSQDGESRKTRPAAAVERGSRSSFSGAVLQMLIPLAFIFVAILMLPQARSVLFNFLPLGDSGPNAIEVVQREPGEIVSFFIDKDPENPTKPQLRFQIYLGSSSTQEAINFQDVSVVLYFGLEKLDEIKLKNGNDVLSYLPIDNLGNAIVTLPGPWAGQVEAFVLRTEHALQMPKMLDAEGLSAIQELPVLYRGAFLGNTQAGNPTPVSQTAPDTSVEPETIIIPANFNPMDPSMNDLLRQVGFPEGEFTNAAGIRFQQMGYDLRSYNNWDPNPPPGENPHYGYDLIPASGQYKGTPLRSLLAEDSVLEFAGLHTDAPYAFPGLATEYFGGFGNHVMLYSEALGAYVVWAHLDAVNPELLRMAKGDRVPANMLLGWLGDHGNTTGETAIHLHFEFRRNPAGPALNPANFNIPNQVFTTVPYPVGERVASSQGNSPAVPAFALMASAPEEAGMQVLEAGAATDPLQLLMIALLLGFLGIAVFTDFPSRIQDWWEEVQTNLKDYTLEDLRFRIPKTVRAFGGLAEEGMGESLTQEAIDALLTEGVLNSLRKRVSENPGNRQYVVDLHDLENGGEHYRYSFALAYEGPLRNQPVIRSVKIQLNPTRNEGEAILNYSNDDRDYRVRLNPLSLREVLFHDGRLFARKGAEATGRGMQATTTAAQTYGPQAYHSTEDFVRGPLQTWTRRAARGTVTRSIGVGEGFVILGRGSIRGLHWLKDTVATPLVARSRQYKMQIAIPLIIVTTMVLTALALTLREPLMDSARNSLGQSQNPPIVQEVQNPENPFGFVSPETVQSTNTSIRKIEAVQLVEALSEEVRAWIEEAAAQFPPLDPELAAIVVMWEWYYAEQAGLPVERTQSFVTNTTEKLYHQIRANGVETDSNANDYVPTVTAGIAAYFYSHHANVPENDPQGASWILQLWNDRNADSSDAYKAFDSSGLWPQIAKWILLPATLILATLGLIWKYAPHSWRLKLRNWRFTRFGKQVEKITSGDSGSKAAGIVGLGLLESTALDQMADVSLKAAESTQSPLLGYVAIAVVAVSLLLAYRAVVKKALDRAVELDAQDAETSASENEPAAPPATDLAVAPEASSRVDVRWEFENGGPDFTESDRLATQFGTLGFLVGDDHARKLVRPTEELARPEVMDAFFDQLSKAFDEQMILALTFGKNNILFELDIDYLPGEGPYRYEFQILDASVVVSENLIELGAMNITQVQIFEDNTLIHTQNGSYSWLPLAEIIRPETSSAGWTLYMNSQDIVVEHSPTEEDVRNQALFDSAL